MMKEEETHDVTTESFSDVSEGHLRRLDEEKKRQADRQKMMANVPIPKLVVKFFIPSLISFLVEGGYGVIDLAIIAAGGGDKATSAFSSASGAEMVVLALGNLLASGSSTLVARHIGANRLHHAANTFYSAIWFALFTSILMVILGLFAVDMYCDILNVSNSVRPLVKTYVSILFCCGGASNLSMILNQNLRSEGRPNLASIAMIVGAIVNACTDAILILGFDLGIGAAAIATLIGRTTSVLVALFGHYFRGLSLLPLSWKGLLTAPSKGVLKKHSSLLLLGLSGCLQQFGQGIVDICRVLALNKYSKNQDVFVSASGISTRVCLLIFFVIMSAGIAAMPIASFQQGAKLYARFRQTIFFTFKMTIRVVIIPYIVFLVFAKEAARIFTDDEYVLKVSQAAIYTWLCSIPFMLFSMLLSFFHISVKKPLAAVMGSLIRQYLLCIPLYFILGSKWGGYAVLYTMFFSESAGAFVMILFAYKNRRSLMLKKQYVEDAVAALEEIGESETAVEMAENTQINNESDRSMQTNPSNEETDELSVSSDEPENPSSLQEDDERTH